MNASLRKNNFGKIGRENDLIAGKINKDTTPETYRIAVFAPPRFSYFDEISADDGNREIVFN